MAIQDTPNYPAALLALGKAEFAQRNYDGAAVTLAKIPHTDRRALEANFYIGLARFNSESTLRPNQPSPSSPADCRFPRSSIIKLSPPAARGTMPFRYFNAPLPPTPMTRTITTTSPLHCCGEATSLELNAKSISP